MTEAKRSAAFRVVTILIAVLVSGCVSTAIVSPLIASKPGSLVTREVVVDNPVSDGSIAHKAFHPQPMANSIALDLAKHFPSIMFVRPQHYRKISDSLKRANLVFSQSAVRGSHVEVELDITSWNPGSAVARFFSSGISNSGEASLSVKATVVEVSKTGVKSKPVAQSIFSTASKGNLLYTGTAEAPWNRAATEIANWVGNQLAL